MTELLAIAVGLVGLALGSFALWRSATNDHTDQLTGLADRRRFQRDVATHARRAAGTTAMLFIDIDGVGSSAHLPDDRDDVLRVVGSVLERRIRKGDVAYRYGSERFCVLLPATDAAAAALIAERIRRTTETLALPHGDTTTISIGLACGPAAEIDAIIDRAAAALRTAQHGGCNRISVG